MDSIDEAQDMDARFREQALRRVAPAIALAPGAEPASRDCADCGEDIPHARLSLVPEAVRCAFCQSQAEGFA